MSNKEATARIKTNKLLEATDWRFFAEGTRPLKAMTPLRYCGQPVNMKLESFMPVLLDKVFRGELR